MPEDPSVDPAVGVSFSVMIGNQNIGMFTTCDGLSMEIETEDWKEGGNNMFVHKLPKGIKYTPIKLTRPVNADSNLVARWLAEMTNGVTRTTCTITARTVEGQAIAQWKFNEVYPVKWTGPSFALDSPKVATETLELQHHGLLNFGSTVPA